MGELEAQKKKFQELKAELKTENLDTDMIRSPSSRSQERLREENRRLHAELQQSRKMLAQYTEEMIGMELNELVGGVESVHWHQGRDTAGAVYPKPASLKPISIKPPVRQWSCGGGVESVQMPRTVAEDSWFVSLVSPGELKDLTESLQADTPDSSVDGWNVSLASPAMPGETCRSEKNGSSLQTRVHCWEWVDEGKSPSSGVVHKKATPRLPDGKLEGTSTSHNVAQSVGGREHHQLVLMV